MQGRVSLLVACLCLAAALSLLTSQHAPEEFIRTGRALPSKIIAGEIHYSRIPVEYWEHRLQMVKAMGINALSVYVMWNYHELSRNKFDYETGNKNLPKFLALAKQYGFYVLIRPGPYVCAEWDLGGLPPRLLVNKQMRLRTTLPAFIDEVKPYFQSLVPVLSPFLAKNDGPIILLQIQNEYGFFGKDKKYIDALRAMWKDLKFECDEYYVDIAENLKICHWDGANIGINNGIKQADYDYARSIEKKGAIFGGEIYSGWLTHWGEAFQGLSTEKFTEHFDFLFSKNHSYSMYMVHGGSNFGLTAGANGIVNKSADYEADITSYDYDAPINEQGAPTQKFYKFRELAQKYLEESIPEPPAPLPVIHVRAFNTHTVGSLFDNLPYPTYVNVDKPYLFESEELGMFKQGIVVYETTLSRRTYELTVVVHDFAVVYVDDRFIAALDRSVNTSHHLTFGCNEEHCRMYVVVEAMGHINFDHSMDTDRKGLFTFYDKARNFFKWTHYPVNIDTHILDWKRGDSKKAFPSLSHATFKTPEIGDTYLNLENFQKGYVWVNGHLLGRYWEKGPTYKVFCPGVWLRQDVDNDIHVLELLTDDISSISGDKTLF